MPSALSRPASSESLLNSPVSEYARVRAPLAVRCKSICCHRKNRNIIVLTHTVSNFFRRLDAIHHRHLHIHEDRKIASRIRRFKLIHGLGTILRRGFRAAPSQPLHSVHYPPQAEQQHTCNQCHQIQRVVKQIRHDGRCLHVHARKCGDRRMAGKCKLLLSYFLFAGNKKAP